MGKIILYGIPNCDTTKKAINWLNKNKIAFSFHDYKQEGISKEKLEAWFAKENRENIFNKRSTTWRELPLAVQNKVTDQSSAIKIMMEHNSIIKRPVIEHGDKLVIGFDEENFKKAFK
ncbi:MAG TPA: arsenate reductase [Ferruginibacter sp.]|nr:arsenate reductase [Ferruginibacter sp.]